jgi:hypothetical protein
MNDLVRLNACLVREKRLYSQLIFPCFFEKKDAGKRGSLHVQKGIANGKKW